MENFINYNNYCVKLPILKKIVSINNDYENETIIRLENKNSETTDVISIYENYLIPCLKAMKYVLENKNEKFLLERIVSQDCDFRYIISYENKCLKITNKNETFNELTILSIKELENEDCKMLIEFVDFIIEKEEKNKK